MQFQYPSLEGSRHVYSRLRLTASHWAYTNYKTKRRPSVDANQEKKYKKIEKEEQEIKKTKKQTKPPQKRGIKNWRVLTQTQSSARITVNFHWTHNTLTLAFSVEFLHHFSCRQKELLFFHRIKKTLFVDKWGCPVTDIFCLLNGLLHPSLSGPQTVHCTRIATSLVFLNSKEYLGL